MKEMKARKVVEQKLLQVTEKAARRAPWPLVVSPAVEHWPEGITVLSIAVYVGRGEGRTGELFSLSGLAGETEELAYEQRNWDALARELDGAFARWLCRVAPNN